MPRTPKEAPIVCDNFTWYLRRKSSGVYFADGRINSRYNLGKPSLGTRNREESLRRLRDLDRKKAIELGLVQPESQDANDDVSIDGGWLLYMARCQQLELLEDVSPATYKRYLAVRNKHLKFCAEKGYTSWSQITKKDDQSIWCLARQEKICLPDDRPGTEPDLLRCEMASRGGVPAAVVPVSLKAKQAGR